MIRALRSRSLELKGDEHEEIDYKIENSSERRDTVYISGNSVVSDKTRSRTFTGVRVFLADFSS